MKLRTLVSYFALAGAVVPVLLGAVWWSINTASSHNLTAEVVLEKITLVLWPSSAAMVAGAGWDNATMSASLFLVALAINVVLYIVVGAMVWYGIRKSHLWLFLPILVLGGIWGFLLTLK
jgi:hypothetical protein